MRLSYSQTIIIVLVCSCFHSGTKASESKPVVLAEIAVTGMEAVPLDENTWSNIPKYLKEAKVYSKAVKKDRHLELTAKSAGAVLIAVSWKSEGGESEEWALTRLTNQDLSDAGWSYIGWMTLGVNDHHWIYLKHFKKGESVRFHTRKDLPPYALLPTQESTELLSTVMDVEAKHDISKPRVRAAKDSDANSKSTFVLGAHESPSTSRKRSPALLLREIVRQGVLITAREEVGVPTRDRMLREIGYDRDAALDSPVEVVATIVPGHQIRITLFRCQDGKNTSLLETVFELPKEKTIEVLTGKIEQLSRTVFPQVLKDAGFSGTANSKKDAGKVPEEIENLLADLSLIAQFSAIRKLHGIMRTEGESPATLAALARGYANLGLLTESHFSPAHKAFKARALLYAERGVAAAPETPGPLWNRAYVRTLVGRHHTALDDLAGAKTLSEKDGKANGTDDQQPSWVDILDAICSYNEELLERIIEHPTHPQLARLLRMKVTAKGSNNLILMEASRVLQLNPECYVAYAAIYGYGPLGIQRRVAFSLPGIFGSRLYGRLMEIPEIPAKVQEIAVLRGEVEEGRIELSDEFLTAELEDRVQVIRALKEAGKTDKSELSWGVLGQLLLETTFEQGWYQLRFLRYSLAVDADDRLELLLPSVQDHPFESMYDIFSSDPKRVRKARLDYRWIGDRREFEMRTRILVDQIYYVDEKYWSGWIGVSQSHSDEIFNDMVERVRANNRRGSTMWIRRMQQVNPHQPFTIARTISQDWTQVKDRLDELEERYQNSAAVQGALGKHYSSRKRYDEAERCLKRQVELDPSKSTYTSLATNYKEQDKEEQWLATLEEFLENHESLGLEHAQVRHTIARHFMKKDEWERAWPYAEEAAQSYSEWGLRCAKDCAEGLDDLEKAEEYIRAISGRYRGNELSWYMWCKRFNYGDLDAAREQVREYIDSLSVPTDIQLFDVISMFHLLEGEWKDALDPTERAFQGTNDPYLGLHLFTLCEKIGHPTLRDKTLQTIAERGKEYRQNNRIRKEMIEVAKLFREFHDSGEEKKLDLKQIESILKDAKPWDRTDIDYFIGRFLQTHGEEADAKKYFLRCAQSKSDRYTRVLAAAWLHEQGLDFRTTDPIEENEITPDED